MYLKSKVMEMQVLIAGITILKNIFKLEQIKTPMVYRVQRCTWQTLKTVFLRISNGKVLDLKFPCEIDI
jgi:uncharacterized membrane protein YqhA